MIEIQQSHNDIQIPGINQRQTVYYMQANIRQQYLHLYMFNIPKNSEMHLMNSDLHTTVVYRPKLCEFLGYMCDCCVQRQIPYVNGVPFNYMQKKP